MLLNRLNVFTSIKHNNDEYSLDYYENNNTFRKQNDVVLDEIIRITPINPLSNPQYAKVYDLTVPSTINFGLANGLHVVDTADTGIKKLPHRGKGKMTHGTFLSFLNGVKWDNHFLTSELFFHTSR